jgi:ectoine hydroxylase-related dioxygenase (phytanoyl-CoA dioxygenase family)
MALPLNKRSDMASIAKVPFGTSIERVKSIVERDGGVILEDFLSPDQVASLNAEVDPYLNTRRLGPTGNVDELTAAIFGKKTKRITQLVTRSSVFRSEILAHGQLLDYVDSLILPSADSYWLSTAHVIEIHPGERRQILHRDFENYPVFRDLGPAGPEASIDCIVALTEFTEEAGGTRVIPGSHKWPDFNDRGSSKATIPLEMKPGSMFLYSGKLIHGGGANQSNGPRRALLMLYVLGWLMPEEAFPFYVPMELARSLPIRAQQLIGFRSFHNASKMAGSLWQIEYEELADFLDASAADQSPARPSLKFNVTK